MATPDDVRAFCDTEEGITSTITHVGATERDGWECDEWNVRLTRGSAEMRTTFYTGTRFGFPTTADVVASLVSDAWTVEDGPDEFAALIQSDTTATWTGDTERFSPTLTEQWRTLVRQTEKFKAFVGDLATTLGLP